MGRVLYHFGSIPKKKFTVDVGAIRSMEHWVELGATVARRGGGRARTGRRLFDFDLDELIKVCVEIRTRLTIRTKTGRVYEATPRVESPLKWAEIIDFWRQRRSRAS